LISLKSQIEPIKIMQEEKVVLGIGALCSVLTIIATVVVVPQLTGQIQDLRARVHEKVELFRVETDAAWSDLMEVQMQAQTPAQRAQETPSPRCSRSRCKSVKRVSPRNVSAN